MGDLCRTKQGDEGYALRQVPYEVSEEEIARNPSAMFQNRLPLLNHFRFFIHFNMSRKNRTYHILFQQNNLQTSTIHIIS
jgi:hypothetical protein